jgi:hypothetical protein
MGFQKSQAQDTIVTPTPMKKDILLSVKVICKDSIYFLVPDIKLLNDAKNISIHKNLTYGNERDITDCKFYLQKIIGDSYINLYEQVFRPPMYDPDYDKFKKVSDGIIKDTISLSEYVPLEPGEYRIAIELKYFKQKEEHTASSHWFNFTVLLPNKFNP